MRSSIAKNAGSQLNGDEEVGMNREEWEGWEGREVQKERDSLGQLAVAEIFEQKERVPRDRCRYVQRPGLP